MRPPFAPIAVEGEELFHFREREADRLRPQNELQPRAFPPGIDAAAIRTRRREKAFRLVEADGARRNPELLGEFGDAIEPLGLGQVWAYVRC